MGAWAHLLDFGTTAAERGIPVLQMIHDYSLLCLRNWLVNSDNRTCSGPVSASGCYACVEHGISRRARLIAALVAPVSISFASLPWCRSGRVLPVQREQIVARAFEHMRRYRESVSLYLAQAPENIEVMVRAGHPRSKFRLVPQFIGEDKLRRYPRAPGRPGKERPLVFVYVGRWSPEKGSADLVTAFHQASFPIATELRLILSNPQMCGYAEIAGNSPEQTGQKCLVVYKGLTGAKVSEALAQSDLCIVPSRCMEVGSRVVLEAHAQGVPVVCSNTVGNRYLISDGKNGRVYPAADVTALKACLEEVACHPALLDDWSRHLTMPVNRAGWKSIVLRIVEEVVGASRCKAPIPQTLG